MPNVRNAVHIALPCAGRPEVAVVPQVDDSIRSSGTALHRSRSTAAKTTVSSAPVLPLFSLRPVLAVRVYPSDATRVPGQGLIATAYRVLSWGLKVELIWLV